MWQRSTIPAWLADCLAVCLVLCLGAAALAACAPAHAREGRELADLSLEELGLIEVTSVSRQAESLFDAPAAVYVITREDIARSGVTSIPEALRLAPGVEVARRNAHEWSISIRGFNGDLSNKLLVLMDGRSVYSPLYAGVFWDVQDTMMEDIDRIEVVAGPGGTMWGANAVNGVINIITRPATETLGGFAEIGGGAEEQGFGGFRYGREIARNAAVRGYVRYFDRDASRTLAGSGASDDWRVARGGFRLDWNPDSRDSWRVQGDLYDGEKAGEFPGGFTLGTLPQGRVRDDVTMSGGNVMASWRREFSRTANVRLQVYYDRTNRDIPNTYEEARDTFDVDLQHTFDAGARHSLMWGVGFRLTSDEVGNTILASFEPDERRDRTYSFFLQDKIALASEKAYLTIGSKFEENDYSGFEWQPNARLSWLIDEERTAWLAASRAVRIPARLDADLLLTVPLSDPSIPFPLYVIASGSDEFDSEVLTAYEAGFRWKPSDVTSLDLAGFYNDYDDLQTNEAGNPVVVTDPMYAYLPTTLANGMHGETHGGTIALSWQATPTWLLRMHYSYLDLRLALDQGSLDIDNTGIEGNSPRHQASLISFVDLLDGGLSLYTAIRYVDELPNQAVADYTALDISLRWRATESFSVSLTGRNLADPGHREFGSAPIEVERSVYLKAAWTL